MQQNFREIKPPRAYLPQLLLFIFADEICNNYILNVFTEFSKFIEFGFYLFFLIIQIICSPIQSGYSDFYCRKKSLVFSLLLSALSMIPAFFYSENLFYPVFLLFIMSIIKGMFGNNLPLSWAGIADTQTMNVRLSLAFSTSSMALGYLGFIILSKGFGDRNTTSAVIFLFFITLSFLCIRKFIDIRDKKTQGETYEKPSFKREIYLIVSEFLMSMRFRSGLLTFMLWEISFYTAHMLDVDLKIKEFKGLTVSMICGYLVGVACLWKLPRKKDEEMIRIGYLISIISFIPIFALFNFVPKVKTLIVACYFFYALGAAFLAPSLFSTLSKERALHEQGKIYGLLDSSDTIAFLVATIITMSYYHVGFDRIFVVFFSFFIFLISWLPYARFKKLNST